MTFPSLIPIRLRTGTLVGLGALGLSLLGCDSSPTGPTVSLVEVSAPTDVLRVDETIQLSASARDASGNTIPDHDVLWTSSEPDVAAVSGGGAVTGIAEGHATITAEVQGVTGQVVLLVVNPPDVSSISPSVLRPGEEFTISGERFDPNPENNQVFVFGTRVTVLEASETSLTGQVADFVCGPEGMAPVVVSVGGQASLPFEHPFEPDGVQEIGAGEFVTMSAPSARCLILDRSLTGATYLVGVQSTSGVPTARTPVRIQGFRGELLSLSQGAVSEDTGYTPSVFRTGSGALRRGTGELALRQSLRSASDPAVERWTRHIQEEARIRAADERAVRPILRAGGGAGHLEHAVAAQQTAGATVPADVEEGDEIEVRVVDLNGSICTDFETVQTVVRRVGSNSVWLEDVENPEGGLTLEDFTLLSGDYENEIHPELAEHFGEPTDLDDNGRVVIVVSRRVNEMTANTLGFVVSSDFVPGEPPSGCPSSNGGEFYYVRAPDPQGEVTDPDGNSLTYTREDALADGPRLLAHEVTHIIQFGRRILETPGVTNLEERWLLEGQAVLAEEVVGHRYTGHEPGSNLGRNVAFGDHDPRGSVAWYDNAFIDLAIWYGIAGDSPENFFNLEEAPHSCGWMDLENPEPCISGRIGYGVTWSLLRWLSDNVAADEQEFQQRIVESTSSGLGTLTQALGTDVRPLMAPWAASHYTDGRVLAGDPLLSFPSWNLRDIEAGLVEPARLTPEQRGFVAFERELEVAAGSTTYQIFHAGASHPPFAVSALTPDGEQLPESIQLWVVRLP